MRQKIALLSLLLVALTVTEISAQGAAKLEVRPKRGKVGYGVEAKNATINLECSPVGVAYGTFSVQLYFKQLTNINYPQISQQIVTHFGEIAVLSPRYLEEPHHVGELSFKYIRGSYDAQHVEGVIYRLPIDKSKQTTVKDIPNKTAEYQGVDKPAVWEPTYFAMEKGDLIYAARTGVVVEIKDGRDLLFGDNNDPLKQRSYIIIEHSDGTLAEYYFIEHGSQMVKLKEKVTPETPIARAGTVNGEDYQVSFVLYQATQNGELNQNIPFLHKSITPIFATTQGDVKVIAESSYTPNVRESIITQEMTSREINRYNKSKR